MATTRRSTANTSTAPAPTVHTLKVTLAGSRPPIWRRLQVSSSISLRDLHDAIQAAFGWEDYHVWFFETPLGRWGVADRELRINSAAAKRLDQVAPHEADRLAYIYDLGDDWEHTIAVEAVTDVEPGVAYPRCLAGRRACPPEDCGGVWGYDELVEILADPEHEEHQDRLEWLGLDSAGRFDPAAFDLARTNAALSGLATVLIKD